jgi:hypothetical protein
MGDEPNQGPFMNGIGWWLVDRTSLALECEERDAVLGDVAEAGESAWQALLDVFGLVIRRQTTLWKNWQPWLAAFGLALPGSLLLMGLSVAVSQACQQLLDLAVLKGTGLTVGIGLGLFMCQVSLLIGWSWTGGFLAGSVSRRTIWATAALSALPCMFCLARFRIESLSRLCLLLFLPPAIWGVRRGLRAARVKLAPAVALAVAITALTIPTWRSPGTLIPNCALSWPAWYLVAVARRGV